MPRLGRAGAQLRAYLWKSSVAEEVSAELAFHIEMLVRQYVAQGLAPDDARAAALERFGDRARIEATCRDIATFTERDMTLAERLLELRQDLAHGLRQLARHRAFAAAAVLLLALGIGATTAMFSVVHAVLLRPLPFPEPHRLVRIYETNPSTNTFSVSEPNFLDWRTQTRSFASLGAFRGAARALTGDRDPRRITGVAATASFFDILGAKVALGRPFTEAEDRPGGNTDVVVISDRLWRGEFGADPAILGRAIQLDGRATTVIGVLHRDFDFGETEIVFPLAPDPQSSRGNKTLSVIGRMGDGVSIASAQADLSAVARRLAEQYPRANKEWGARLESFQDWLVGPDFTRRVLVLQGAVAFLLLLACANVANLLLARAMARQRELGVRAALGAARGRLVRQLLTESAVLSLLGGAVGLLLAFAGVALLRRLEPAGIPRVEEVGVNGAVLAFALGVALLTGLVFGAVPALQATRATLSELLKSGARVAGGSGRRLRGALVIAQVAVAMVLLVGAGLLTRSFIRLQEVSPGYDVEHVLTGRISMPAGSYPVERIPEFQDRLIERLSAIPGVEGAATTNIAPFAGGSTAIDFRVVGEPEDAPFRSASWRSITPGYFRTMRIPLLAGRALEQRDDSTAPNVVVITESLARRISPGESALGKRIRPSGAQEPWTVVGVVADIRDVELAGETQDVLFLSNRQVPWRALAFLVRTRTDPGSVAAAVRRELKALDSTIPIRDLQPLAESVRGSLALPRFSTVMLSIFAGVALLLAALGIYAVMAFTVAQRTREIGVRIALGARPSGVVGLVVRGGAVLAVVGIIAGIAGAAALTRVLSGLLFGVTATDVGTYGAVAVLLALVALLASAIPARRAAHVDPLVALRSE